LIFFLIKKYLGKNGKGLKIMGKRCITL